MLEHTEATPLPAGFFAALKQLAPFGETATVFDDTVETEQARVLLPSPTCVESARFGMAQLRKLDGIATAINFSDYPQPCRFIGERTRGVIVGTT